MAGLIDSLRRQDFGEDDSLIASAAMHPAEGAKRLKAWLESQINTGMGQPQLDESTGFYRDPTDEQQHEAAFNLAGLMETGSMPFAPKSAGGTLGTFIGPKAKNWNAKAAAEAAKLLDEGMSPTEVWRMKLMGRMPDGKMFSEIDDSQAVYRGLQGAKDAYAGDAYIHPELYDNYPTLENMTVKERKGGGGSYDQSAWEFLIGRDKTPDSTMPHETQHAIQDIEGWARGGDSKELGKDIYWRQTGEAQARAVQDRLNMTMLQRRSNYPLEGGKLSDTPLEQLINRYGGDGPQQSMAALPETEFSRAHATAQRNAALPVDQGGLGLAPDNTAMDRAKALGFDTSNPVYHATQSDFAKFDNNKIGSSIDEGLMGSGHYFTNDAENASNYARNLNLSTNINGGENIIPSFINKGKTKYSTIDSMRNITKKQAEAITNKNIKKGYQSAESYYGYGSNKIIHTNIFDPKNIRSRFAAFDPFNKDSSNILASGLIGSLLLNELDPKQQK